MHAKADPFLSSVTSTNGQSRPSDLTPHLDHINTFNDHSSATRQIPTQSEAWLENQTIYGEWLTNTASGSTAK